MVHIVDWYPTLLSLAGLKNEDIGPVDGVDLWPLVTRDVSVRSTLVYNIDVTVDKPFIFMIQDTVNEIPILVGRINNPLL